MLLASSASESRIRTLASHPRAIVAVIAFSFFIDYFLYGLLVPLVAHLHVGLELEGQFAAFLYGIYGLSVLLVTPIFGYFGERIGGRSVMLSGVALASCATALYGTASSPSMLVLARFCQGAASAALWTSGLALIAAAYAEKRVEMFGYAFSGGTLGSVLGPLASGALYHAGGYKLPLLITGALLAVDAPLVAFLIPAGRTGRHEVVDFRALLLSRSIVAPALTVALAAFSLGIIEPLLPLRLAGHGATSLTLGVLFTISTVVYGLSAPLVGRVSERISIQRVIVMGMVAMAVSLPLMAAFGSIFLIGVTLCLANMSYAFMLNPASAELGNVVDRAGMSCYSAVYAVYNIVYSIGMLVTTVLASAAVTILNFWGVLLCASAILLLSIPALSVVARPEKAIPRSPVDHSPC